MLSGRYRSYFNCEPAYTSYRARLELGAHVRAHVLRDHDVAAGTHLAGRAPYLAGLEDAEGGVKPGSVRSRWRVKAGSHWRSMLQWERQVF